MAQAGIARTMRRFARAIGPKKAANGTVRTPRSGASVFWARFTPPGTNMALLKKGSSPWAAACGTQAKNQAARIESLVVPKRCELPDVTTGQ